jgi:hypothetical protein
MGRDSLFRGDSPFTCVPGVSSDCSRWIGSAFLIDRLIVPDRSKHADMPFLMYRWTGFVPG